MKEYGVLASWTFVYTILKPYPYKLLKPISFLKNPKELLVNFPSYNVSSLDMESWDIKKVEVCGLNELETAYVCYENLLMLKENDDVVAQFEKLSEKAKRRRLMNNSERYVNLLGSCS